MLPEGLEWIKEECGGIKFKYAIDVENREYYMKILTKIPRGYYYSICNEIGELLQAKLYEAILSKQETVVK